MAGDWGMARLGGWRVLGVWHGGRRVARVVRIRVEVLGGQDGRLARKPAPDRKSPLEPLRRANCLKQGCAQL